MPPVRASPRPHGLPAPCAPARHKGIRYTSRHGKHPRRQKSPSGCISPPAGYFRGQAAARYRRRAPTAWKGTPAAPTRQALRHVPASRSRTHRIPGQGNRSPRPAGCRPRAGRTPTSGGRPQPRPWATRCCSSPEIPSTAASNRRSTPLHRPSPTPPGRRPPARGNTSSRPRSSTNFRAAR